MEEMDKRIMEVARNAVKEYLKTLMKTERDVFNPSKEDMKYILNSFVYGNVNEELKRKITEIRKISLLKKNKKRK